MSRIYWDSMLFIYWIEDHPRYARRIAHILDRITERGDALCTSTFTLAEVLTGPYKRGDERLATQIREVFRGPGFRRLRSTIETGDVNARSRHVFGFAPGDA